MRGHGWILTGAGWRPGPLSELYQEASAMSDPEVFYQDEPTPYWSDPDSSMTSDGVGWWRTGPDGERVGPFKSEAEARTGDELDPKSADELDDQEPARCRWCRSAPCRCEADDRDYDAWRDRQMEPEE